jgi:Tfp pilus assembly protein PilX
MRLRSFAPLVTDNESNLAGTSLDVRDNVGPGRREEKGAVLILALVYIIVVSLTAAALTTWASNDLNNTTKFQSANENHYAVTSAMNTAIESERYSPLPTNPTAAQYAGAATTLGECWAPSSGSTSTVTQVNNYSVSVWCSTVINLASSTTRSMTAYACPSSVTSAASCEASPTLTAVVEYDDYPTPAGPQLTEQCNLETGECGYSETLLSWTWG